MYKGQLLPANVGDLVQGFDFLGFWAIITKCRPRGRFKFEKIMITRFIQYIKDTRGELKHVSWPTQRQTITFTILVILLSLVIAFYIGVFDFFFGKILNQIV